MLSEPLLALWCISMVLAVTFALAKRRSPLLWLALALPAGPFALILLLPLGETAGAPPVSPEVEAMELCDACLEVVRRDRTLCRHCGAGHPAT